jgi:hypothetical protein
MKFLRTAFGFGAFLLLPAISFAQSSRTLTAESEFPEAFGMVSGIREMPDGRLMVTDALGQMLMWVDMDAGTMDQIGREGQGPEEYRTPDALYALPGDSTLLVDLGNGRLTVLDSHGRFGRTMPIGRQVDGNMLVTLPRGVDGRGRIYFQPMGMMMRRRGGSGLPQPPDSAAISRWDPTTDVVDTLGNVKLQETLVEGGGGNVNITGVRMSPQDAWAVAADGRVAVARAPQYRVDWLGTGAMRSGDDVSFRPVRVGRGEKLASVVSSSRDGLSIRMSMNNGVRSMSFGRGGGNSDEPDISGEWPAEMQAFGPNAVRIAPDGNAWVSRNVSAGSETHFDVFGSHGNLQETVRLPAGRQIVGFGAGVLYAVYFDEFDLQYLERYRL